MDDRLFILLLSIIAGGAGTTLGGVLGVLLTRKKKVFLGRMLAFAGGVMLGVVCFEMIPEAIELSVVNSKNWTSIVITLFALAGGVLVVYVLNKIVDIIENKRTVHSNLEDIRHETGILQANDAEICAVGDAACDARNAKRSMLKAGFVMFFAIALHNFPEGMAIGASGTASISSGITVAIIIAIHDIPEGMTISAPLASGGVGKAKAIFLTAIAGFATVPGALLGILLGGISRISTGVCVAIAGGAMLYVTFGEIMPQVILMEEGRIPAISTLVGLVFAMVIVYIL